LTLDNASANDTLITALSKILINQFDIQFVPGNSQIRCLNHVLNLVVQKVLATLNEAEDPDNLDYFDKSLPVHYSAEDDPDQLELEREKDEDIDEDAEEETDDKTFDELLTSNATQLSATQKVCVHTHPRLIYSLSSLSAAHNLYEDRIITTASPPLSTCSTKDSQGREDTRRQIPHRRTHGCTRRSNPMELHPCYDQACINPPQTYRELGS